MMKRIHWQKSSYSEANGPECVEVARLGEGVVVRESDDPRAVLTTTPARLGALVAKVKADARFGGLS